MTSITKLSIVLSILFIAYIFVSSKQIFALSETRNKVDTIFQQKYQQLQIHDTIYLKRDSQIIVKHLDTVVKILRDTMYSLIYGRNDIYDHQPLMKDTVWIKYDTIKNSRDSLIVLRRLFRPKNFLISKRYITVKPSKVNPLNSRDTVYLSKESAEEVRKIIKQSLKQ